MSVLTQEHTEEGRQVTGIDIKEDEDRGEWEVKKKRGSKGED